MTKCRPVQKEKCVKVPREVIVQKEQKRSSTSNMVLMVCKMQYVFDHNVLKTVYCGSKDGSLVMVQGLQNGEGDPFRATA